MSREQILARIRQNKPAAAPLPELPDFFREEIDPVSAFIRAVENGGGKTLPYSELEAWLAAEHPAAKKIASTAPGFRGNVELTEIRNPAELNDVDVAVITTGLGIAESGAVWVTEADCVHRVLPFITQHLAVVLDKNFIVQNTQMAYKRADVAATGFGVFIAGPSKTADIEQSLVVGAQGARSYTVFLR